MWPLKLTKLGKKLKIDKAFYAGVNQENNCYGAEIGVYHEPFLVTFQHDQRNRDTGQ